MTKLVSGRILKTPSANVSAERYQFLEISEAEPDLGLPPANGYVFTSDTTGVRSWIQLSTDNVLEGSNLYYTNDRVIANLNVASIDVFGDVVDLSNIDLGQGLIWNGNAFAPVYISSDLANIADLAIRVLSLENFTTANIAEASSNLYFTNSRVLDALVKANVIVNDLFVSGDLVVQGNTTTLNVATLIIEDKNIVIANGAPNAAAADNAGITIEGANATILYKESGDKFELNKNLDVQGNIIAGSGTGGSITGANVITTQMLAADLLVTDTVVSNTILNTASITAETVFGNVVANTILTDSLVSTNVISDFLQANSLISNTISSVSIDTQVLTGNVVGDLTGNVVGNVVGDLTGNVTGDLTGNVVGNVVGDLTGNVTGDLTGNVVGTVSDISNHTTDDLAEGGNLYYTDARVLANVSAMSVNVLSDVDITGILPGQIIAWDGAKFVPGSADVALFSEQSNSAVVANTVLSLEGLTTDDLNESSANLYFSNTRARQAFSAGRGIIIQENGVIKSTDDSDLYNLDLNGGVIQNITLNMAPILSLPTSPSSVSYVVQSLHVTNISEETALLSANVVFASNSTVTLFNKLALPVGASMELFDKGIALKPGDKLNVQSFNQSEVATSNVISAFLVYESVFEDESFINAGTDIGNPNSNVLLYNSNLSYTILESIKISNLEDIDIPVRVYVTDANANIKGYLTHKMPVPSDSVVDILKKPKRLERNDRIYINYTDTANTNAISVFLSGRIGAYYILDINPGEIAPGTDSVIGFETTAAEGTQLYYTIRPA